MVKLAAKPFDWFITILQDSDQRGGRFYLDEPFSTKAALWRVDDGTHTYLGTVEFIGFNAFWLPDPAVRYVDVPYELRMYEDRRSVREQQQEASA